MTQVAVVSNVLAFKNRREMDPLVGPRVERQRARKGWTQAVLAQKAGVATNTVNGLENGKSTRWPQFQKIAAALGVTTKALQTGEDLPEDNPLAKKLRLSDEALRIGKRFQEADTEIRLAVDRLLRAGNRDPMFRLWQRIEALNDARRRETLFSSLAQHEQAVADEKRARAAKRKPTQP
jgi:transcriptional regulator with XRE-family HTH domain